MVCRECGAELSTSAAFCQQCGTQVGGGQGNEESTSGGRLRAAVDSRRQSDDLGEEDVWTGRYSHLAMIGWWIAAAAVTVVLLIVAAVFSFTGVAWAIAIGLIVVMWLGLGLQFLYRQLSIRYELTNQRFIHERGILWRTIDRIELIDVDDVTFNQGPVERMFGVGTVLVTSSDRSHPELHIKGIENVREVAGKIDDLRRAERHRRGLHIESV